jgi:hypothetical protein
MQKVFRIPIGLVGACTMLYLGLANALAAQVALVIDISDSVESAVQAFSEIEAGDMVDLGTHGRLEFLDYYSCKNVVIVGGRVSFTDRRFLLRGGKIIDESRGKCPKVVTLNKDARVGGVRLRSSSATLRLPARPWLAFTGRNRDFAVQVRILRKGSATLTLSLNGWQLQWPEDWDELSAGSYMLEILSKDGAKYRGLPFEVTSSGRRSKMTIIRIN